MSAPLVIVGDLLLDRDIQGVADRLCPDAPAAVLTETASVARPGGAGLAACLLAQAGVDVQLVTAIGDDGAGEVARQLLERAGVAVAEIPYAGATPEKIRLRAGPHTLVRLDRGVEPGLLGAPGESALKPLRQAPVVLVSDYGRGVTALPQIRRVLAGVTRSTPVVWDPHPKGSSPVPGAHLACPNRAEASTFCAAHGVDLDVDPAAHPGDGRLGAIASDLAGHRRSELRAVAAQATLLRRAWHVLAVAVTAGADGAVFADAQATRHCPARPSPDGDPCGAGDRFATAAAQALAEGATVAECVATAVDAASRYVAAGGPQALVYELEEAE
jgi:D-beta-D-heptose 7-phosphate kinase/D-beta-D-heptose 1-phosphate adenosyltransferase